MKTEYIKILLIMLFYYLTSYTLKYFIELDNTKNALLNFSSLTIGVALPLSLFYIFFIKKKPTVDNLYVSCFFTIAVCSSSHFGVKVFMYQYLDTERPRMIAKKMALNYINRMESIERKNKITIGIDKNKEYKKVYNEIISHYSLTGILESIFIDFIIYFLISICFVYFMRQRSLKTWKLNKNLTFNIIFTKNLQSQIIEYSNYSYCYN